MSSSGGNNKKSFSEIMKAKNAPKVVLDNF